MKRNILLGSALLASCAVQSKNVDKPNVVLIVCDDLNDYITGIKGKAGHPQVITPHIDRFSKSATSFSHAYSNIPVCAPSRSSFLTGIYGHTSGNLFWTPWYKNEILNNSKSLMHHFKDNDYHVVGSGKLMHHFQRKEWNEFPYEADYGPHAFNGKDKVAHPSVPKPFWDIGPTDGSYGSLESSSFNTDGNPKSGWVTGKWNKPIKMKFNSSEDRDPTPDERNASWAAKRIEQFAKEKNGKPFFMGVGFIRPHTPLHVPQKYFDKFPLDKVKLPVIKKGDAADTHFKDTFDAKTLKKTKGFKYFNALKASYPDLDVGLKTFTQAYLACVAAVDECIGEVIEAVDNSPFKNNTIIILTSDHGWNMGEKDYLFKHSPWEESTRVPFIVRAPGVAKKGAVAEHPISLIDLYPTLVDLCNLKGDTRKNEKGVPLDGHSVRPFLKNPKTNKWDGPKGALSMIFAGASKLFLDKTKDRWDPDFQHWAYRTKRYRYIKYNTGKEELYDHKNDPNEWTNVADNPEFSKIKKDLENQMMALRNK